MFSHKNFSLLKRKSLDHGIKVHQLQEKLKKEKKEDHLLKNE